MNCAEIIFGGAIIFAVSLMLILIGKSQIKSKKPVGFYTFESPLKEGDVKDVALWNRRHGMMFVGVGISMIILYACGLIVSFEFAVVFPCAGIVLAIPVMAVYHARLRKRFLVKK